MARLLLLLLLVSSGCSARGGAPAPSAPHAQPGVAPSDAGPASADGGGCPAGQQRCCDGQCNTPSSCAALSCDPTPPPAEQR